MPGGGASTPKSTPKSTPRSKSASRKRATKSKAAGPKPKEDPATSGSDQRPLRSAAELEAQAEALRAQAEALMKAPASRAAPRAASGAAAEVGALMTEGAMAEQLAGSIKSMMEAQGLSRPRDLFRAWDQNGDGKVTRLEFRRACSQMKLSGGAAGESAALDALFASLDLDGGGNLSLAELTQALKTTLKAESPALPGEGDTPDGDVNDTNGGALNMRPSGPARLSALAAVCERAAAATRAAEEAATGVDEAVGTSSVPRQVASILLKRNMKAADVVKACTPNVAWDSASGEVRLQMAEVASGLRGLGVSGDDEEVMGFVRSLDVDQSGTVELSEFKSAIKRFQAEQRERDTALVALKGRVAELQKVATREQTLLSELEEAEAKAEEAAQQAATQQAEAKQAASEAKAEATKAAAKAASVKTAEEKRAFEARVAAKRAGSAKRQGAPGHLPGGAEAAPSGG